MLTAALVGAALGAGAASAGADVVPGTEDGWGSPPGGVMLSVSADDGSGNHILDVTWGAVDPIPADGGYWQCQVNERSTTTRLDTHDGSYTSEEPVVNAYFDVKLLPPSGGSYQQQVTQAPGERIKLDIRCLTYYPSSTGATPPSPAFGWHFDYQLS